MEERIKQVNDRICFLVIPCLLFGGIDRCTYERTDGQDGFVPRIGDVSAG